MTTSMKMDLLDRFLVKGYKSLQQKKKPGMIA